MLKYGETMAITPAKVFNSVKNKINQIPFFGLIYLIMVLLYIQTIFYLNDSLLFLENQLADLKKELSILELSKTNLLVQNKMQEKMH